MTELKRPESYVQFESIKPKLKEVTEFYTRKTADYQYRLKQLNEYADALENEISALKETPKVEVLLDDTAKQLVSVPQFVADWFENAKGDLGFRIWQYIRDWRENEQNDFWFWFNEDINNTFETLIRMKLEGYTVKKAPKFSLVNKNTGEYLVLPIIEYRTNNENIFDNSTHLKKEDLPKCKPEMYQFTEVEITSIETGSYEQIEVIDV